MKLKNLFLKILMTSTLFLNSVKADQIIPVAANTPGAQGSYWKTDLQITNPGTSAVVVSVAFEEKTKNYMIEAGKAISIDNVLEKLGASNAFGVLKMSSTQNLIAGARTFNEVIDEKGKKKELGQYMQAYSLDERLSAGDSAYIIGAKDTSLYRTNLGLSSLNGANAVLELLDPAGNVIETKNIFLGAGQFMQNSVQQYFNSALPDNFSVRINVENGDLFAYGSVVHNATGDGNFQKAQGLKKTNVQKKYDQLFLHDEVYRIFFDHKEEFAEIFCRENIYFIDYFGNTVHHDYNKWITNLTGLSNGSFDDIVEYDFFYIKNKNSFQLGFVDAKLGLLYGWNVPILGWTQKDIDDFNELFFRYYEPSK